MPSTLFDIVTITLKQSTRQGEMFGLSETKHGVLENPFHTYYLFKQVSSINTTSPYHQRYCTLTLDNVNLHSVKDINLDLPEITCNSFNIFQNLAFQSKSVKWFFNGVSLINVCMFIKQVYRIDISTLSITFDILYSSFSTAMCLLLSNSASGLRHSYL